MSERSAENDQAECTHRLATYAGGCPDCGAGPGFPWLHTAEDDALARLASDVSVLLAKYEGRSKWVGFEPARREAWAEIERDLRAVVARVIPPAHVCPECGDPVTREQPCWIEPETKQRHHDPCPLPPGKENKNE